jgi:diadenylate cyclase
MQLSEHVADVPSERDAVVRDYHADPREEAVRTALAQLEAMRYSELLDMERLAELLGYPRDVNPLDHSVAPRGFRILSRIPRLPEAVARQVVQDMDGLESIVRASQRDLEAIAGVGAVRARELREGLRRLQEHNLVDRYLQL